MVSPADQTQRESRAPGLSHQALDEERLTRQTVREANGFTDMFRLGKGDAALFSIEVFRILKAEAEYFSKPLGGADFPGGFHDGYGGPEVRFPIDEGGKFTGGTDCDVTAEFRYKH